MKFDPTKKILSTEAYFFDKIEVNKIYMNEICSESIIILIQFSLMKLKITMRRCNKASNMIRYEIASK